MLIKNGLIMNPRTNETLHTDIRGEDGLIKEIGTLTAEPEEEVLDIEGLIIAPGLIDTHIHFRDPGFTYKEDIHTGALSAAAGGFTTVICMANTKPVVDNVETLKYVLEKGKQTKVCGLIVDYSKNGNQSAYLCMPINYINKIILL